MKSKKNQGKQIFLFEVSHNSSCRTCHSLERNRFGSTKDEQDDFILVLSDGEQRDEKVELIFLRQVDDHFSQVAETIDHWASSAEESQDEARIQQIRQRLKGKLSGVQSSQSSDSIR